jgi:DNA-binding transcriptional regulator GbsR (MarR family)
MKKAGPHNSNGHTPKRRTVPGVGRLNLTPELQRFVQHMGSYFENVGVPRIGGLILGLLIIAHEPLSAEDIASILKVSRASISTNFKILSASGLAERFTSHADRLTYYTYPDSAWERILEMGVQRAAVFKRIVQEGLAALPPRDLSRQRLEVAEQYTDLVADWYRRMIADWHERRQLKVASRA